MGKSKSKAAVEDVDDELELIEDDEEAAPVKSKGKKGKAAKEAPEPKAESTNTGMGASWLAEYVNEELGTDYTAAQMRVVLRKMAADGDLEREVGTDRARYQFTGEKDPTVRAVLKRVKSGEADQAKKERLEAARSGKGKKAKDDDEEAEVKPAATAKRRKSKDAEEDEAPARPAARRRRKSEED